MIKKITKAQYPDIWAIIIDDWFEESYSAHRRGSNFYKRYVYEIDRASLPNNPELYGFWESDTVISDAEYGDDSEIVSLTRVSPTEQTIIRKVWVPYV